MPYIFLLLYPVLYTLALLSLSISWCFSSHFQYSLEISLARGVSKVPHRVTPLQGETPKRKMVYVSVILHWQTQGTSMG